MRKLMISITIAAATLTSIPASAQSWRLRPMIRDQIQSDINQLDNQIDRATRRGRISQREATGLRRDARRLQRTYNQYARNGLTRGEVATLEARANVVRQRLRLERRDWDGRRG